MEFDEDLLDIAEVLLEILKGMNLAEGVWLMNLVSAAMHYPDIFFKEWLGKVDNRELISDSEQTPELAVEEDSGITDENKMA